MNEKEYFNTLSDIRGSRKNEIIIAVNRKLPAEDLSFRCEVEQIFYHSLWTEAEAHARKYGTWPVFEMCEIETDDPVLDIYSTPPKASWENV